MLLATTPLTDFSTWLRSDGLEIVMLVSGAVLVSRVVTWLSHWEAARINQRVQASEALVRSEATKHRQAVTGVVTWAFLALLYFVVAILVLQRLGVPIATLLGPAAVAGVALGFGAQRVVQDVLAGFLIVTERQYGYGDTVRITATAAVVVIAVALGGSHRAFADWVYRASAVMLGAVALLTAVTGARTPVIFFKICPVLLCATAAVLLTASWI